MRAVDYQIGGAVERNSALEAVIVEARHIDTAGGDMRFGDPLGSDGLDRMDAQRCR